jgi:ribosome-associated translation inhibitor RaiA
MSKVNISGRNFSVTELSTDVVKELAERFKCPPTIKAVEEVLRHYKTQKGKYFHLD